MPTTVLTAPSFAQSVQALTDHPVIDELSRDLLGASPDMMATLTHDGTEPTNRFIGLANDAFAERTGEHGRYLGTVARAVLARLAQRRAAARAAALAFLPNAVTEARAAELEAQQAIRDMWAHGYPRCPLTRYAEAAGRAADAFNA